MKKMAAVIAILPLLLFPGCALHGGVKESAPPLIISSLPANGAVKVSANAKISITVSTSLDKATVNPGTVTLRKFNSRLLVVPGKENVKYSVSYPVDAEAKFSPAIRTKLSCREADRTITIAPVGPLEYGAKYRVLIEGVKDTAGNAIARTAVTFTTFKNPVKRSIRYREGAVDSYTESVYDANGKLVRETWYHYEGADGKWFTKDDIMRGYTGYTYDANGNPTSEVVYDTAGPDGKWFTPDDMAFRYDSYEYDANGNMIRDVSYEKPGPDGKWFTADDVVYSYSDQVYDANGNRTRAVWYRKGPDRKLLTADDEVSDYASYVYDSNGNLKHGVRYYGAGPDGKWFTEDDVVHHDNVYTYDADGNPKSRARLIPAGPGAWNIEKSSCSDTEAYDPSGNLTRHVTYIQDSLHIDSLTGEFGCSVNFYDAYDANGTSSRKVTYKSAGPDGQWFTADDEVWYYSLYDANGNRTREVNYKSAGPDGTWFTADDEIIGYSDDVYDANGNLTRVWYGKGPDRKWFTSDDAPSFYSAYSYDVNGNPTRIANYGDEGLDGKWFTEDDTVKWCRDIAYDVNGNRIREAFCAAGADGKWSNSADALLLANEYATGF